MSSYVVPSDEPDEVARYAASVRSALSDLPEPARSELLEDLEDHRAAVRRWRSAR